MTVPEDRTLRSTCYDGKVITTPWVEGRRWSPASYNSQANVHRERVRNYLMAHGLGKLKFWSVAA